MTTSIYIWTTALALGVLLSALWIIQAVLLLYPWIGRGLQDRLMWWSHTSRSESRAESFSTPSVVLKEDAQRGLRLWSTLRWEQVCLTYASTEGELKKQVLHEVYGTAVPGRMLALMGPSGAGKVRQGFSNAQELLRRER